MKHEDSMSYCQVRGLREKIEMPSKCRVTPGRQTAKKLLRPKPHITEFCKTGTSKGVGSLLSIQVSTQADWCLHFLSLSP